MRKKDFLDQLSLDELLSDPLTLKIMRSDKVEEHELRSLLNRVAAGLSGCGAEPDGESTINRRGRPGHYASQDRGS